MQLGNWGEAALTTRSETRNAGVTEAHVAVLPPNRRCGFQHGPRPLEGIG